MYNHPDGYTCIIKMDTNLYDKNATMKGKRGMLSF